MKNFVMIVCRYEREVLQYAAAELRNYLKKAGVSAWITKAEDMVFLSGRLELMVDPQLFTLEDSYFDDAYEIDVTDFTGKITGSNNRSVLLGVYRYLREIGFAFLRPDRDGERVPEKIGPHTVKLREAASNRYRGICIEGSVSYENILQFVDWMPKVGLNTYFTQFQIPYEFFKTWYEHRNNPLHEKEAVPTEEETGVFIREILVPHMKKRGLIWQAAGHGFTASAAGITATGWDEVDESRIEGLNFDYLAEIDGKRGLFQGVPLNTNLCYSNPKVREKMVEGVMKYLEENPDVDILHFWLADGSNNSCECSACAAKRPSDWYVMMLNQLDEKLSKAGSRVKIVFLGYVDLLWPPVEEKIKNPDRFLFMYAPITRSYGRSLPTEQSGEIWPFERNHCRFPVDAGETMRFYHAWKQCFSGESFLYDYHYMWNHFRDWGDYGSARILWEDLVKLKELGFDGYVSCQQTRVFSPTGFGMYVLAATLWDRSRTFDQLGEEYFNLLFKDAGERVYEYCRRLSELSYEEQPESDGPGISRDAAEKLEKAAALVEEFLSFFEEKYSEQVSEDRTSWKYLLYSGRAARIYFDVLKYRRLGDEEKSAAEYVRLKEYLCETEDEWQEGFDVYWFIKKMDQVLGK